MSFPPCKNVKPTIDDFLATVLAAYITECRWRAAKYN